jgi:hypothetical protein
MTMLLVIVSASAIYVAADSKQFPSGSMTQKLFLVGKDAAVLQGGIAVIPGAGENGVAWESESEFRKIATLAPNGSFNEQFVDIRNRVFQSFSLALSHYNEYIPPDKKLAFFVAKRENGISHLARQEIPFSTTESGKHRAELPDALILTSAPNKIWWDLPTECKMQDFDFSRGITFHSISDLFHNVAAQSAICSAEIGGQIRAAVIDDAGGRWLSE